MKRLNLTKVIQRFTDESKNLLAKNSAKILQKILAYSSRKLAKTKLITIAVASKCEETRANLHKEYTLSCNTAIIITELSLAMAYKLTH